LNPGETEIKQRKETAMRIQDIIRFWKHDEEEEDQQQEDLPANPIGKIELSDDELQSVVGGSEHTLSIRQEGMNA
jgi:mersacidin/lichenicidin family type 2 lantibiotic